MTRYRIVIAMGAALSVGAVVMALQPREVPMASPRPVSTGAYRDLAPESRQNDHIYAENDGRNHGYGVYGEAGSVHGYMDGDLWPSSGWLNPDGPSVVGLGKSQSVPLTTHDVYVQIGLHNSIAWRWSELPYLATPLQLPWLWQARRVLLYQYRVGACLNRCMDPQPWSVRASTACGQKCLGYGGRR